MCYPRQQRHSYNHAMLMCNVYVNGCLLLLVATLSVLMQGTWPPSCFFVSCVVDACPRFHPGSYAQQNRTSCDTFCGQKGMQLAVPYTSEEYTCVVRKGNARHTAMWTGVIETANGTFDRYTGKRVGVFRNGSTPHWLVGRHSLYTYWHATDGINAVYFQSDQYIATTPAYLSQHFSCACEQRKPANDVFHGWDLFLSVSSKAVIIVQACFLLYILVMKAILLISLFFCSFMNINVSTSL